MGQLQPGHTDFVIKYLFFYFDIQCSNKLMEFFLVYCYLPFKDCFILKKSNAHSSYLLAPYVYLANVITR